MKKQKNREISNLDMINFYVDEYKMLREESLQCLKVKIYLLQLH